MLGRRTQINPFVPLQRSTTYGAIAGNVSTARGHLAFATTDLDLPGATPLMFQRTYTSDRQEDAGLGRGWSFTFNDFITLDGDRATLTTADGNTLAFHRDGQSNRFRLDVEQPTTHANFEITDTETLTETQGDTTRTYARRGDAFHLARIQVGNLIGITINHNARGHITRIANDTGGTLRLNWSNTANPRLLSVTDHANREVTFQQSGNTLDRVTDAAGAAWSYDYKDERLTRAVDPMKRVLLRTRYDANGHVIETGDAVGITRFDYEFAAPEVSRRTTVTDSLGAQTFYRHNERGALTVAGDDEGNTARIEYSAANRPVRVADSLGGEAKFDYDADNRLIKQESSDGANKSFAYTEEGRLRSTTDNGTRTDFITDEQGNLVPVQAGNATPDYRTTHNARGQLTLLKSAEREISFEYDANGNQTAFTYSDVGRFEKNYDSAGRIVSERLPSGLTYTKDYDARGWLKTERDNRGWARSIERDTSGAIVGFVSKNGKWIRATRDEAGRVTKISASNGKTLEYAYDARGALTYFTKEDGKWRKFEYDKHGRVREMSDANGRRLKVERDERGKIRRIATIQKPQERLADLFSPRLANVSKNAGASFIKAGYNPTAKPLSKVRAQEFTDPNPLCSGAECWTDVGLGSVNVFDSNSTSPGRGGGGAGATEIAFAVSMDGFDPSLGGGGLGQTKEQCARIRAEECSSDFNQKLAISVGLHVAAIVVEFIIGLAIAAVVSGATVFTLTAPVGYAIAGVIIATTLSGLNDYAQLKVDFDRCVSNATRDCAGLP